MAEIKVEPKRGGLGWLWAVIILAILAAVLWYVYNNRRAVPATTSPADSVRTSMIGSPPHTWSAVFTQDATHG